MIMKNIRLIRGTILSLLVALAAVSLSSCRKEAPLDPESIFRDAPDEQTNVFDEWLRHEFVDAYNIDFKYRMEDNESNTNYNLVPAELELSMEMARVIKYVWLDAYVEVAGKDFMRQNAPGILHVIGSAAWNNDGTMTLGTAEGGMKITLYLGNWFDPSNVRELNEYYFKTMHHEFTHILQQSVNYPQEYNLISTEDYRPSGWQNRSTKDAAKLGFITPYAGSMAVEDITEVTCCYETYSDEEWNQVYEWAGKEGQAKLDQKVAIMKRYMREVWDIDMDQLKAVIARRMAETQKWDDFLYPEWHAYLETMPKSGEEIHSRTMESLRSLFLQDYPEIAREMEKHPRSCQVHMANLMNLWGVVGQADRPASSAEDHPSATTDNL